MFTVNQKRSRKILLDTDMMHLWYVQSCYIEIERKVFEFFFGFFLKLQGL